MTLFPDEFVFHQTVESPAIMLIHNDSMYVRFGGMRNTKTWIKSVLESVYYQT